MIGGLRFPTLIHFTKSRAYECVQFGPRFVQSIHLCITSGKQAVGPAVKGPRFLKGHNRLLVIVS